jgi:hypothetical protein
VGVEKVSDLLRIRDFLEARGLPIVFEGRRGPGSNPGVEFLDPDAYMIDLYAGMDQLGADGRSRPPEEWRRASSLEEAIANPIRDPLATGELPSFTVIDVWHVVDGKAVEFWDSYHRYGMLELLGLVRELTVAFA